MRRLLRSILFLGLTGPYLFGSGCRSEIAEAFQDGVTDFISSTTTTVLEELFPIPELIGAEADRGGGG